MKNYWRIYNYINSTLRVWRGGYLEIGAKEGLNIRNVKERDRVSVEAGKIAKEWTGYHYDMSTDDFLDLIAPDMKERFRVVYLRDWSSDNLEDRVKKIYPMLQPDGVLIVDSFDPEGKKNDAWRLMVGLKKEGYPYGVLKNRFLTIYKTEEALRGKLRSRMKLDSYLKQADKFLTQDA